MSEQQMNKEYLNLLHEKEILSHLDIHFAGFLAKLADTDDTELLLAAALVSRYRGQGHICLDLSRVEGTPLITEADAGETVACPELGKWREKLEKTSVVGTPGQYKPLILDNQSRLYLYRYWEYQKELSDNLGRRVNDCVQDIDVLLLKQGLERLFPKKEPQEIDWQKIAAFSALTNRFCVISGGPGTGKTSTVAKIIALILEQAGTGKVRIALAAPTGKAAARLQEAVKSATENLECTDKIKAAIPTEASTIHRLLGTISGSPYFRHHAGNTLPVDAAIVDEASMVDMALMSKLVQALPKEARLILLGDKDQLASVEAGAVLGDICDSGNTHEFSERFLTDLNEITGLELEPKRNKDPGRGIHDCIVSLKKSYRFGSRSGVSAVSRTVNEGDGNHSIKLIEDGNYEDIKWKTLPQPGNLAGMLKDTIMNGYGDFLKARNPWKAFELFERFRILCALREGPYGVTNLNLLSEQTLKRRGLIDPSKTWYPGRPLLITRNDYSLKLFNGDVGIVLPDPNADDDLRVFFPAADGTLRKLHPLRLPEHETVYAMTVHKSQGSEFERVLLILPDRDYPVLTRELIYTGVTRARNNIEIWGTKDIFKSAVSRRTERTSGLRDVLWGKSYN